MDWLEYLGWTKQTIIELRGTAYMYLREGKYDIALNFFKACAVLSKEDIYDLQMVGALYLQKGRNIDALKYLDKALVKAPDDLPTQLNRAKVLFALGYKRRAIAQAKALIFSKNKEIGQLAQALILANT